MTTVFTKTRRCYEILGLALTGNFVSYLSFDCEVKLVFHVIKCHSHIFVHEWLAPSNVITFSPKCNKPPMQSFNSFNALLLWRISTLRCWSDSFCTEKTADQYTCHMISISVFLVARINSRSIGRKRYTDEKMASNNSWQNNEYADQNLSIYHWLRLLSTINFGKIW